MHASRSTRRGFTWVELIVVVIVIGFLMLLLLPSLNNGGREASRRAACTSNMKQLGTAMHNYASRHGTFPPASLVTRDADGPVAAVDGWSWTVHILPEQIGKHPDGAMYPASGHKPEDFKHDGLSQTIMIAETVEPVAARWAVGSEATLVGLPPSVTFARPTVDGTVLPFFAPTGFDGQHGDDSQADQPRTYLDWDYGDPHDGPYLPGKNQPTFGPGSHHPGAVNHLFVDANVQTIATDIDSALYMFLITREGGDPTDEFFKD
ncbi:MAG: DUF1559 domain-containing protein [Planctomycetes bacterium]|nr:DUF1559 domain-containing protein [Planctomycetota bacterium]